MAVLERLRTKTASKPLRARVETYAFTDDGKVLAGLYPDGSVGVFGGGVDGDTPESAAKKEYREEGGRTLKDVQKIPGAKPLSKKWEDDPSVNESESRKHKERREKFSGSKTIFMMGRVGDKAKTVDGSKLKSVKPRTVDELIQIQRKSLKKGDKEMDDIKRARLQVLQKLRTKTAAKEEEKELTYMPEVYGHEMGHHDFRKGLLGKAVAKGRKLDMPAKVIGLGTALGGLGTEGIDMDTRATLASVGSLIAATGKAPTLVDEAAASMKSLKGLKDQLSPEDYSEAKKRLASAWLTYGAPTTLLAPAAAATLAGQAIGSNTLRNVGLGGQALALPVGAAISHMADKRLNRAGGPRVTASELRAQHEKADPGMALALAKKPIAGTALYVPKPKDKKRAMADLQRVQEQIGISPEEVKDMARRGGILMGAVE